jgi:hypothetical protein
MPTAQKWENVEWYVVMGWQFTGADADSATTIFWDHIMPVIGEAWPGTTCLRVMTGEMGVTCFGPMANGVEALEWEVSPGDVRFLALFFQREGEAGMGLFEKFMNGTTGFTLNIALKHKGGM